MNFGKTEEAGNTSQRSCMMAHQNEISALTLWNAGSSL
jgi:hypothetical protein